MDNVKFRKHCSPEKNKLYADFYEVEATYDREKLSTMLIVQDNNARGYRAFNSLDFSSRSEIPRNVIVEILDRMLIEFRASFSDRRDTPKSLKDLVPIQCVRTIGSTQYKQSLHKKISPLNRSLGTAVDVHRNDLFVNRLSATDHDDNALAKANESTKIDCVPPNTSIHGPLQIHGTTDITLRMLAV
ncbi:6490_t:CDS:2 [Rhizophagus irregularis]|nr:6490_t:CDS:2 [Rhizophagus irregularis]